MQDLIQMSWLVNDEAELGHVSVVLPRIMNSNSMLFQGVGKILMPMTSTLVCKYSTAMRLPLKAKDLPPTYPGIRKHNPQHYPIV